MAKMILEFKLPDEEGFANLSKNGSLAYSCIKEFSNKLRTYYKYGHTFKDADEAVEKIRDDFYECLEEYFNKVDP